MKRALPVAAVLAACLLASGSASAAKCNIVGTWTDTAAGATATFTTNKKGTSNIPAVCSKAYKLTVTTLTKTTWDISGTSKDVNCPSPVTADLTFSGCASASGNVTIPGIGTIPDTFNKTGAIKTHPSSRNNPLASGIK